MALTIQISSESVQSHIQDAHSWAMGAVGFIHMLVWPGAADLLIQIILDSRNEWFGWRSSAFALEIKSPHPKLTPLAQAGFRAAVILLRLRLRSLGIVHFTCLPQDVLRQINQHIIHAAQENSDLADKALAG